MRVIAWQEKEVPDQVGEDKYSMFVSLVIPAEAGISLQIAPRRLLQNEVKLCRFSSRYLMTVDMSDFDEAVAKYMGALNKSKEIAKKMRDENEPVQKIVSYTGLSEEQIRKL